MRGLFKIFFSLCIAMGVATPGFCQADNAAPAALNKEHDTSVHHYVVEYNVDEHAKSVVNKKIDVLLNTRAGVDQWSQVRLPFSEKMESLNILEAYTLTPEGKRIDVPKNRIYTQESYSSANTPLYVDHKVKVIVFPDLQPGGRVVFQYSLERHAPSFPGYFNLWEVFSAFWQYDDAVVRLTAPANLPMHIMTSGVKGGQLPDTGDGRVRWEWQHQQAAMPPQPSLRAEYWEFSPNIMASTYSGYKDMGLAYHVGAAKAATPTPAVKTLADTITAGIADRESQAKAIYQWVAEHIRYVAVYLGNGSLQPNNVDDILQNRYGDCKDYTVVLGALLAAKNIPSTPVLVGANLGTLLPTIPILGRFNHVILYVPEFDLYLDGTVRYARFGQLGEYLLSTPAVHTVDGKVTRTPDHSVKNTFSRMKINFKFAQNGDLVGQLMPELSPQEEIRIRYLVAAAPGQAGKLKEAQDALACGGYIGTGRYSYEGTPDDLNHPFGMTFHFEAPNYVDFESGGGMAIPNPPSYGSMRFLFSQTSAVSSLVPFPCVESLREETYVITFPESVPIMSIPRDYSFSNAVGSYSVQWKREGSVVTAAHRLKREAVRGANALCQSSDYSLVRELYSHVYKGFNTQVIYGQRAS